MSDTGGFPLVGGSPAFPGKNNVTRDSSGSNSFGWENLNVGNLSVVSGYRNKVTKNYSFSAGLNNSLTALYCFASGSGNTISQDYSSAFGIANVINGVRSFVAGSGNIVSTQAAAFCSGNAASGTYSFAVNFTNIASASASFSCGLYSIASRYGEFSHGGVGVGIAGSCQHGWLTFSNQSTSATPIILYLDGIAATQRAVLAAGARWNCTLKMQACTTGAIDKDGSWEYAFTICRPTTAASTIIRSTPLLVRSDGSNAGAPPAGWSVAITADTTNGCPQIQVTGDTDTINWTAALHYVQSIRV